MTKAILLWVDLEMTGLEPADDRILELAAIGTDWGLGEIFRFTATVKVDDELARRRMVGDFWEKNRKLKKVLLKNNENGRSIGEVEQELVKIIDKSRVSTGLLRSARNDAQSRNGRAKAPIYLAGNSIHQDRKFIEREMPLLNSKLHYRMLDISAWKIVFAEKFGVEYKKPEVHRALDDIEGSIDEFKYYLENFVQPSSDGSSSGLLRLKPRNDKGK
jgi:oligoribonuclease